MRSFSVLVLLGALGVLPAIGCSNKADLEKAQEEAKKFKAEADRLRAEFELLRKAQAEAAKPNPPPARDFGGIAADVVAAWEKAGAKFGWLTTNDQVKLIPPDELPFVRHRRWTIRKQTPPALPTFASPVWPLAVGLDKLPKSTAPFGLSLAGNQVTDGWIKELAAFDQLAALDFSRTQVTEAGLLDLAPLTQFHWLFLDGLPVTDVGLKNLTGFKQLHTLSLFDTNVSRAGVAALRKALPKVGVAAAPLK
jgi:hypothetical protein